jgi:phage shock protein PspC (stress-responsive transcriptional regulator)
MFDAINNLSKSKSDVMIGGVCGGLGARTPIPTWMWRAGFLASLFFLGTGGLVYLILWIALPDEKPVTPSIKQRQTMNYLLIRHNVADFTKWKAAYDAHAPAREQAGLKEVHLLRNSERLEEVVLMYEVKDVQKAREFGNSPDLKEAMQNAGVVDKPDIWFLT